MSSYRSLPPTPQELPLCIRVMEKAAFELGYNVYYKSLKGIQGETFGTGILGQIYEDEHSCETIIELEYSMEDRETLEILIHEIAHGVGDINYEKYVYKTAEAIVELVTRNVCDYYGWGTSIGLELRCDDFSDYVKRKYKEDIFETTCKIVSVVNMIY